MSANRNWRTEIRLTYKEKELLEKKSKKAGLPQSTLIRFLLDGYEPQEKPDDKFYDKLEEIRKVSTALKDIAYTGLKRGWTEMEIYNKQAKILSELILEIRRDFLMPRKVKK